MKIGQLVRVLCIVTAISGGPGHAQSAGKPVKEVISAALAKGSLMGNGSGSAVGPFHIQVVVSESKAPQSPYQATIEEWWVSPTSWRREVTAKGGMKQTIVVANGNHTERDEGDYFPLWLRSFVTAVFDPIPLLSGWPASNALIELPNAPPGYKTQESVRMQSSIGTGERATDAFANLSFDESGLLSFIGGPGYSMEFHDYKKFENRQVPRRFIDDPEPGTELVGEVPELDNDDASKKSPGLLEPLQAKDDRFTTVKVGAAELERMTAANPPIVWPPVRSGNVKGKLAVYIATDSAGKVREAWPLNSDNAGLEDPARAQIMKWTITPAESDGKPVQVEGGLGFAFDTSIADPLPHLSNEEVRALAKKIVEPQWPSGSGLSGQTVEVEISVNETGKFTGASYRKVPMSLLGPINVALGQWKFRPLIRDGKPTYFHATLAFKVP